jgi:hypothetical protein
MFELIPLLTVLLELAEEMLLTVDGSATSLRFVRNTLAGMRWGNATLATLQLWDELSDERPSPPGYQEGEMVYLSLLGGALLTRSKIITKGNDFDERAAGEAILRAAADAYQRAYPGDLHDVILHFVYQLGVHIEDVRPDASDAIRKTLDRYPSRIFVSDPIYEIGVRDDLVIPQLSKDLIHDYGVTQVEFEILLKALRKGIGTDKLERIIENRDGINNSVSVKTSSLMSLLYAGAKSASPATLTQISWADGPGAVSFNAALTYHTKPVFSNSYPSQPPIYLTKKIIDLEDLSATFKLGYEWDPELKQLVRSSAGIVDNVIASEIKARARENDEGLLTEDQVIKSVNHLLKSYVSTKGDGKIASLAAKTAGRLLGNALHK